MSIMPELSFIAPQQPKNEIMKIVAPIIIIIVGLEYQLLSLKSA